MAVRQYVGARYVPNFYQNSQNPISSEWEGNKAYDALTIVTYNNSSYTSKIPVPAGIGNPAQNPTYWVNTANYNAQVEQYRQITADVQSQYTAVQTSLNNEIDTRTSADTKLQTNIDKSMPNKILCIGDSYGMGRYGTGDHPDEGWANLLNTRHYFTVYNYCESGAGFTRGTITGNTFNDLLNRAKQANVKPDMILLAGGTNDIGAELQTIADKMVEFVSNAKTFNVPIYIVWDSNTHNVSYGNFISTLRTYSSMASALGCPFFSTTGFVRIHANTMSTDSTGHLSKTGYQILSDALASIIKKGAVPAFINTTQFLIIDLFNTGNYTTLTPDTTYITFPSNNATINGIVGTTCNGSTLIKNLSINPGESTDLFGYNAIDQHLAICLNGAIIDSNTNIPCEIKLLMNNKQASMYITASDTNGFYNISGTSVHLIINSGTAVIPTLAL